MSSNGRERPLTPCGKHSADRCPFRRFEVGLPVGVRRYYVFQARQTCKETRKLAGRERRIAARELALDLAWETGDKRLVGLTRALDQMVRLGRRYRRAASGGGKIATPGRTPPLAPSTRQGATAFESTGNSEGLDNGGDGRRGG
jgi:hypothetical protein